MIFLSPFYKKSMNNDNFLGGIKRKELKNGEKYGSACYPLLPEHVPTISSPPLDPFDFNTVRTRSPETCSCSSLLFPIITSYSL